MMLKGDLHNKGRCSLNQPPQAARQVESAGSDELACQSSLQPATSRIKSATVAQPHAAAGVAGDPPSSAVRPTTAGQAAAGLAMGNTAVTGAARYSCSPLPIRGTLMLGHGLLPQEYQFYQAAIETYIQQEHWLPLEKRSQALGGNRRLDRPPPPVPLSDVMEIMGAKYVKKSVREWRTACLVSAARALGYQLTQLVDVPALLRNLPADPPVADGLQPFVVPASDPRVQLRGGKGLRATLYFPEGALLGFYRGTTYFKASYDKMLNGLTGGCRYRRKRDFDSYGADFRDGTLVISALEGMNELALVNDPNTDPTSHQGYGGLAENCRLHSLRIGPVHFLALFTMKSVMPGQELTYCYGEDYWHTQSARQADADHEEKQERELSRLRALAGQREQQGSGASDESDRHDGDPSSEEKGEDEKGSGASDGDSGHDDGEPSAEEEVEEEKGSEASDEDGGHDGAPSSDEEEEEEKGSDASDEEGGHDGEPSDEEGDEEEVVESITEEEEEEEEEVVKEEDASAEEVDEEKAVLSLDTAGDGVDAAEGEVDSAAHADASTAPLGPCSTSVEGEELMSPWGGGTTLALVAAEPSREPRKKKKRKIIMPAPEQQGAAKKADMADKTRSKPMKKDKKRAAEHAPASAQEPVKRAREAKPADGQSALPRTRGGAEVKGNKAQMSKVASPSAAREKSLGSAGGAQAKVEGDTQGIKARPPSRMVAAAAKQGAGAGDGGAAEVKPPRDSKGLRGSATARKTPAIIQAKAPKGKGTEAGKGARAAGGAHDGTAPKRAKTKSLEARVKELIDCATEGDPEIKAVLKRTMHVKAMGQCGTALNIDKTQLVMLNILRGLVNLDLGRPFAADLSDTKLFRALTGSVGGGFVNPATRQYLIQYLRRLVQVEGVTETEMLNVLSTGMGGSVDLPTILSSFNPGMEWADLLQGEPLQDLPTPPQLMAKMYAAAAATQQGAKQAMQEWVDVAVANAKEELKAKAEAKARVDDAINTLEARAASGKLSEGERARLAKILAEGGPG